MLAKDNKSLIDNNKTLVNKISNFEIKNNDLMNKCKIIEKESGLQIENLSGKNSELA